jgi:carbon starvation protein CstA
MRRLRDGEWIAGAGAVALLASMFLHWYALDVSIGPLDQLVPEATAWQAFGVLDVVLALLALVPLTLVVTQATRPSPAVPVFFSVMTVLAGALATLLILYRIADQPGPNEIVDVQLGAWLGLLAAVVVAAGGWRSLRVEPIPGQPLPPIADLPLPAP